MKKAIFPTLILLLLAGCHPTTVSEPDQLIDQETMADIIYDLSVLEALKSRQPQLNSESTADYVYKKYGIDSVQFAQNNRFYASQIGKYQKIYADVNQRLDDEKKLADSLARSNNEKVIVPTAGGDAPQIK